MIKALAILFLLSGFLYADEAGERKAIESVIGSLFSPQVRSDPQRMAELMTADFEGELSTMPVRRVWCENSCEVFRVLQLKFVTSDVAILDGETTMGTATVSTPTSAPLSRWLMVLRRDASGWRISSIRSFVHIPFVAGSRPLAGN